MGVHGDVTKSLHNSLVWPDQVKKAVVSLIMIRRGLRMFVTPVAFTNSDIVLTFQRMQELEVIGTQWIIWMVCFSQIAVTKGNQQWFAFIWNRFQYKFSVFPRGYLNVLAYCCLVRRHLDWLLLINIFTYYTWCYSYNFSHWKISQRWFNKSSGSMTDRVWLINTAKIWSAVKFWESPELLTSDIPHKLLKVNYFLFVSKIK